MDSLSFGSIMSRELNIKPPYGKTCEWILHHPDYLAWLDPDEYHQHHGFLWCVSNPRNPVFYFRFP
ncbi:hypothetical protein F4678DRAFT_444773 [Xylaria arbuscula]|nr:hypothetical protein F4678DRAFT_444773 [Xylaria arbuscula]